MLRHFLDKRRAVYYVQVWEQRLKVFELSSKRIFDEPPLLAIHTGESERKSVLALGHDAMAAANGNKIECINPFSHPRTLFSDFNVAEKLLKLVILKLSNGRSSFLRPRVLIHPMEMLEGGLTQIEIRAFRELAFGAGAYQVKVHIGDELRPEIDNLWETVISADEI